jgi:hypothetical protein
MASSMEMRGSGVGVGIRWVRSSAGERRPASGGDVVVAQGGVGGGGVARVSGEISSREGWRKGKGIEEVASVLVWVWSFFLFTREGLPIRCDM